jgi:SSS family transporter
MSYLESSAWLVIGVYLAGIIAFGVWFGKGQQTTQDYFLGSKSIPWWGVGLSIVATETSALTFIGVPALAYEGDLAFIQIIVGYVIARVVLAVVMVPHYFKGEIYSPYQLFANAFGPGARRLAGGCFLIAGTLAAGVRVYVTCVPIQLMLGIEMLPAILLFVGLSLIYTYVGGIKAVVWTDAVQFVLFLVGGLFTLVYVPQVIDLGWSGALAQAAAAAKLRWLNTSFSLTMPFNLWMGLFGATAMVMASHGADQLIVQRVLTCRSVGDGRRALVLSAVIILPLFLLFLLTGTMLWAYYQQFPLAIRLPEPTPGFPQTHYIFPIFMLTAVPPVFKGFLIVGILSAAMSSVSSALSALASVSTMDFAKALLSGPTRGADSLEDRIGSKGRIPHGERAEAFYLRLSKHATLFWALMLVGVAYLSRETRSVLNLAFDLSGLTSGALLGGLLLAVVWKRGRAGPVVIGMLASLAVMTLISLRFKPLVAWPWYTLIGTSVTVLVAWAAREAQK